MSGINTRETNLSVNPDEGFAMSGVDFVSTVRAQSDPGNT